jgi:hypothetical protein
LSLPSLRSAHTYDSIHREGTDSLKARILQARPKEAHNGRQRRQKGQRERPEAEGDQTYNRSEREEGQTTKKRTEIGAGFNR